MALGASIQGGVLSGDVDDILLLDVTPLSLGIETLGGVSTRLIERNATIPTKKSQIFSTAAENQTTVEIHVLQGERPMSADNKSIGRFQLADIPPAPRGVPQIEVIFDIDANGILNVTAQDKATGKEQNIKIEASSGLSDSEIDKMVHDAKKHESEDKEKRESIDLVNQAEHLIYETEKNVKEYGDKLDEKEKDGLVEKVEALKKAKDSGNIENIKTSIESLNTAWSTVASKMYDATKASSDGETGDGTSGSEDDKKKEGEIDDADFEVVE